jgi:thymidylate synthase ThyX
MLARCRAHPLVEVRALAEEMNAAVVGLVPSLIKYTEPTPYEPEAMGRVRDTVRSFPDRRPGTTADASSAPGCTTSGWTGAAMAADASPECGVRLVSATPSSDETLAGILLFASGCGSMEACRERADSLTPGERRELLLSHLSRLGPHDAVLREYEHVSATFEVVVSGSCFAQLKRHRMATLTVLPYDPSLGVTVPPALTEAGLEPRFREIVSRAEDCAARIAGLAPPAAAYGLTNAHRRRVLVRMNARELYHLSRLREDAHAQWDIRRVAARMLALARERMPLTLALAAGKDRFDEVRGRLFP